MSNLEQIGAVTTRSGGLIVVDTGYLGIWFHDRPPVLPDGSLGTDEETKRANSFVDLRIVGQDAGRAGRMLDMSWRELEAKTVLLQSQLDYIQARDEMIEAMGQTPE